MKRLLTVYNIQNMKSDRQMNVIFLKCNHIVYHAIFYLKHSEAFSPLLHYIGQDGSL